MQHLKMILLKNQIHNNIAWSADAEMQLKQIFKDNYMNPLKSLLHRL